MPRTWTKCDWALCHKRRLKNGRYATNFEQNVASLATTRVESDATGLAGESGGRDTRWCAASSGEPCGNPGQSQTREAARTKLDPTKLDPTKLDPTKLDPVQVPTKMVTDDDDDDDDDDDEATVGRPPPQFSTTQLRVSSLPCTSNIVFWTSPCLVPVAWHLSHGTTFRPAPVAWRL